MKGVKKIGSKGSIAFFYKGHLCSMFPLTEKKTLSTYQEDSRAMNEKDLRDGFSIVRIVKLSKTFCELFYKRRINGEKVSSYDHKMFMHCLLFLLKIGCVRENDKNGFIMLKRPKRKIK
jgi:hypothetical protein